MDSDIIKVATPQVGEEEVAAVREVLLSGSYVSGIKVKEFEEKFAEYIGTKYAVAVGTGTAALFIALEALGIGKGDEVIVPPLTFFATVSSVLYLGAVPVFADLDMDDLCLSPESVEQQITAKTKAILPVHLFGAAAKMDEILDISGKHGLIVVEDCAQAHGTEYKGKKVGATGHAGAFSFFATKHMTTGEGGMITTNSEDVAEQCKVIRSHGMSGRDDHLRLGYNNRMTEMEAAMGIIQLKKLDELNRKRIENSEYLLNEDEEPQGRDEGKGEPAFFPGDPHHELLDARDHRLEEVLSPARDHFQALGGYPGDHDEQDHHQPSVGDVREQQVLKESVRITWIVDYGQAQLFQKKTQKQNRMFHAYLSPLRNALTAS